MRVVTLCIGNIKEEEMPLTKTGRKVLRRMYKSYGKKRGKRVFYATMNKYKKRWHK